VSSPATGVARMPWALVLAGAVAVIVGLGFARFSYSTLIPGMIDAGWFSAGQTAHLGAANLLGYLFGALSASSLATRIGVGATLRIALVAVVLSFFLCAFPAPFSWFFGWRLLAGWAGAVLMVVAPSTVLALTPAARRPMAAAWIFSGIGVGILAAALLMPVILKLGVSWGWLALGVVSLMLTLGSWQRWSRRRIAADVPGHAPPVSVAVPATALLAIAAYGLSAFGFVPHTLFWVDFIARERGFGMEVASLQWALFALGAIAGPFAAGWLARRSGWFVALLLVALIKALVLFLSAGGNWLWLVGLCSLLAGGLAPAMVSLTSGYVTSLVNLSAHRRVWGWATAAFAVSQAVAAQGMAALYSVLGTYVPLFLIGGVALLAGALLILATRLVRSPAAGG